LSSASPKVMAPRQSVDTRAPELPSWRYFMVGSVGSGQLQLHLLSALALPTQMLSQVLLQQ
jgi:hypothetical protein